MVSNTIKLSLGSLLFYFIFSCTNRPKNVTNVVVKKELVDTCKYYRYDAGRIVSNLGCQNCHLLYQPGQKDDRGWATFSDLAAMDSLTLINYTFTKKHKDWYSKTGTFKKSRMDTLSDCEIKSVIRYIKDYNRSIAIPSQ